MGLSQHKNILFLGGNHLDSRFAEILFNFEAKKLGLLWEAASRNLTEGHNTGLEPAAESALKYLQTLGDGNNDRFGCPPVAATAHDMERADLIVALTDIEAFRLISEQFLPWTDKIRYWQIEDTQEVLPALEREVKSLLTRLILEGGRRQLTSPPTACPECHHPMCTCRAQVKTRKSAVVLIAKETKGRHGKTVSTISGLPLDDSELSELAMQLKQRCGSGGTVKDGRIEIQGDHRDKLRKELEGMGYRVKRVGG